MPCLFTDLRAATYNLFDISSLILNNKLTNQFLIVIYIQIFLLLLYYDWSYTLNSIKILSGVYLDGEGEKHSLFREAANEFEKSTLSNIDVKGKVMYWELTPQQNAKKAEMNYILISFGMTGGFRQTNTKHSRIEFIMMTHAFIDRATSITKL